MLLPELQQHIAVLAAALGANLWPARWEPIAVAVARVVVVVAVAGLAPVPNKQQRHKQQRAHVGAVGI